MQNIIFFDTKESEKSHIENELSDKFYLTFYDYSLLQNVELDENTKNAQIISVFTSSRLTAEVLSKFNNLKLIAARSVGFSHIDIEYCKAKGIKVVNTPHYGDYTVAEFSFGLLLSLVRKIGEAQNNLKIGEVNKEYSGIELFNKKIGIIGLGGIGSKALKIAEGFSMEVLVYDVFKNEKLQKEYNFEYVDVDYLCENSDIISLHAPATKNNYHLINDDRISKMKNGVIIVNTARGELIDSQALYRALLNKKIAGAALDVLECEEGMAKSCNYFADSFCEDTECMKKTLTNHKLLNLPNVLATPHTAYDTKEAEKRIIEMTLKNIVAFYNNTDIENEVNK